MARTPLLDRLTDTADLAFWLVGLSVAVLVVMTAPRSLIQLRSAWRWNRTALLTDWRRPWVRPWVKRRIRQWLQ